MTNKRFLALTAILLTFTILLVSCTGGSEEEKKLANLTNKAEAGDAEAQFNLGRIYESGEGVPKDAAKAMEWYQKAAIQGNANAQNNVGRIYEKGESVPKDITKAREWYQKAATQGNADAQYNFGRMSEDATKTMEWYQKAAEQGHAEAQMQLGAHYALGEGVPKDMTKAFQWCQRAAEQGHANAQFFVGEMYARGEVVPRDLTKAAEWYQKAAVQGDVGAQLALAGIYYIGESVPKDSAKAAEWYQKAAAQGNAKAQFNLGVMYAVGDGVNMDEVLAYAWYNLAAAKGNRLAKSLRDALTLTTAQRAEAERLSSNWKQGQILARQGGSAADKGPAGSSTLSKIGTGTAFFVSKSGQAITNYHVVGSCSEVRAEGREGMAKVVTTDAVNDIALVQIPGTVSATAPISSDPAKLRQGEDIVVFGFPLNAVLSSGGNLTPGVVSAVTGLGNNTNQIQITAPIQPGSSGSPVLNKKGEVVGMVSMKLSDSTMVKATGQVGQNVNFAVSGQTLKTFLDAHKVDYRRTWLLSFDKSTADLADEARQWTVVVECWK